MIVRLTYNGAMGRRLLYALLGSGVGLLIALILGSIFRKPFGAAFTGLAGVCAAIAVSMAEKRGKVETKEELDRPITLFPPASVNTSGEESK